MADNSYVSFLPYLRQGLAGSLENPDTLGNNNTNTTITERGEVTIKFDIQATPLSGSDSLVAATRDLTLVGPGDIIGISSGAIVRVCPADWETNFEPDYMPFVEFYDEDFLWRYTPASPNVFDVNDPSKDKLRPWITLVALKEDEFNLLTTQSGPLPGFELTGSPQTSFPNEIDTWAWGHVHVNADLGETGDPLPPKLSALDAILKTNPDKAVSRLICGRRLEPNTAYHMFLIPTFEVGRAAGLGLGANITDGLYPAWTWITPTSAPIPASPNQFPYYQKWYFKTGAGGDFESLARLIKPAAAPEGVGQKLMDLQWPGEPELLDLKTPVPAINIEGTIKPPDLTSDTWTIPDATNDFITGLTEMLNAPQASIELGDDPVIAPPLYGRWHAELSEVNGTDDDWFHTVNLDPRFRVFASLGAEVVRNNQDSFMAEAWEQVGEVIEANRLLNGLQVGQEVSNALYRKNFATQPEELVLTLAGNAHARLLDTVTTPASTVHKQIKDSLVPNAMFSAAFRRISSPNGVFARICNNTTALPFADLSLLNNVNTQTVTAAPSYAVPVGQMTLTAITPAQQTMAYTQSLPARANFSVTSPNPSPLSVTSTGSDSTAATSFRTAAIAFHAYVSAIQPGPSIPPSLNVPTVATAVITAINPPAVFTAMASQVLLTDVNDQISVPETVAPVMAAPAIRRPMYKYLTKLSPDWMVPGLNELRQNTASIFEMNQKYIEAYMLGLNHEFARELLWRGYPTDQRGTYFSHFWDFADSSQNTTQPNDYSPLHDIKPIHQWRSGGGLSDLGNNSGRTVSPGDMLIVSVRGDLLKKYPSTSVYMNKAKWDGMGNPRLVDEDGPVKKPLFTAKIQPDILFFGFDLSIEDAKGTLDESTDTGWFFVFQERAGEIRFGLDALSEEPVADWSDLQWGNFVSIFTPEHYPYADPGPNQSISISFNPDEVEWGRNSADIAYALMQLPVRLALHAKDLLE